MNIEEFLEEYNYSPVSLEDMCRTVVEFLDPKSSPEAGELYGVAQAYIGGDEVARAALDKVGFEFG